MSTDFRPGDSVMISNPYPCTEHLRGASGVVCTTMPALSVLAANIFNDETGKLEVHHLYFREVSLINEDRLERDLTNYIGEFIT